MTKTYVEWEDMVQHTDLPGDINTFMLFADWTEEREQLQAKVERLQRSAKGWEADALNYAKSRGCQEERADKAEAANAKLVEALNLLLFLHQCEQEAVGRPPTPEEWMTAVDKGNAVIEELKS